MGINKRDFTGPFIGFTFNGIHSSDLGIVRQSDSDRYTDNLIPVYTDKTVAVPGGDGTYYFGSNFTQRVFDFSIAFDFLTEENLRKLKQLLGDKNPHELIFDEYPYKVYVGKISGNPTIKTLCFDEEGQRVYKGEGTFSIVCYDPRGYCKGTRHYKDYYLSTWYAGLNYSADEAQNEIAEWWNSSGLKIAKGNYDTLKNTQILLWNPGDGETDFYLDFAFTSGVVSAISISLDSNAEAQLNLNKITAKPGDYGIRINSKTNLIEGIDSNKNLTGQVYNNYIKNGNFFKIPKGESTLILSGAQPIDNTINYDYWYF